MDCIISGVAKLNDRINETINSLAEGNRNKQIIYFGFLHSDEFKEFVKSKIDEQNDVLKNDTINWNEFTINEYSKINKNTFNRLLKTYYKNKYHSVENSTTRKNGLALHGFLDVESKQTAKVHNAQLIIEEYRKEINKSDKRSPIEIIKDVNEKILNTFYDRMNSLAEEILHTDSKYSEEVKIQANKYKKLLEEQNYLNESIREYNSLRKTHKELKEFYDKNKDKKEFKQEKDKVYNQLQDITNRIGYLHDNITNKKIELKDVLVNKFFTAYNLANLAIKDNSCEQKQQIYNYTNLVFQTRSNTNEWYFYVFNTKAMTSIVKEFNTIDNIEKQLESETNTEDIGYHGETIDEFSKSWEDKLYKNFTDSIDGRLKIYLSSIPKLSQKYNTTSKIQSIDTNNKLGVPTYLSADVIISQIFSFSDCSSVISMIESIEEKANNTVELYGLGYIVDMMKSSKVFANYMFSNFAKPIADKVIMKVTDKKSTLTYNNEEIVPVTEFMYSCINKIKTTYDINEELSKKYSKILTTKGNKFKKENLDEFIESVYPIINTYLPNINKQLFTHFLNNIPNEELDDTINNFIRTFIAIIEECNELKEKVNEEIKTNSWNFLNDLQYYNEWYENNLDAIQKGTLRDDQKMFPPTRKFVTIELDKPMYDNIEKISKMFIKYSSSKVKLNSINAAGKMASDVIKNCYVTRFFEQLNAGTKEDENAGLKAVLYYFTQQNSTQYANNPILFGLKDENGKIIKEGLFIKAEDGNYDINPNAKNILKYMLFDGVKNEHTQEGTTYAKMNKIDFTITQYNSFLNAAFKQNETNEKHDYINKLTTYPMRIGADAPKIFFIRSYKYTNDELRYCLYNHVIDELNMFCTGLTKLFEKGNDNVFRNKKSVKGLIGRLYYNERVANELEYNNEIDFTKAIIKDGKLVGNIFKFFRLFNTKGFNASAEIERMLSLYGEGFKNQLLTKDKNGGLILNPNDVISYNENAQSFEINLDDGFKQYLLEEIVDKWINAFLFDAKNELSQTIDIMKSHEEINFDNSVFENWLLNLVNINITYDDLFEGDFKFYGGTRDAFKRAKEVQSGGDSFAGYDVTDSDINTIKDLNWYGNPEVIGFTLNEDNVKVQPIEINGKQLVARNGWRAVTIYNTIKVSDHASEIQQELERIFIKQGIKEYKAKEMSNKIAEGYGYSQAGVTKGGFTKINDAQSYITFEEWIRRRHADGTINDYKELIEKILDPNISAADINIDEINKRIQVDKNFYFDKVYDSVNGVFAPRQIKNAEFVLIPKLLPEDSELRKIHDWMQSNNIGQLNTAETSKASKKNIFTIWDSKTGKFNENFEKTFDGSYIENYYYQYLYKQQEVSQHMVDEHNKAGSQLLKKIIDNIYNELDNNDPNRKRLQKLAKEFLDAYSVNIEESAEDFLDKMGWEYDPVTNKLVNSEYNTTDNEGNKLPDDVIEENRTTLNFNFFYSRAREEAARTGQDSNFMEYLTINEFGKPIMPNYYNINSSKIESVFQSIFNRQITRQTLPGWHGAQITGVGYSKKLEFDAKTGVMQVYLPRWSKLIPKGKTEKENADILKQIEKEGLDIHIGYRIPTEGKQSISVLKVVGFTNDCLGSMIIVPNDWVTQTGSDFDVDSIYGVCWEMYQKVDKHGKISLHKIPYDEKDIDNKLNYIGYVNRKLENKVKKTDVGEEIKSTVQEIREKFKHTAERNELNKHFKEIDDKRNELYEKLPKKFKFIIIDENRSAETISKKDKKVVDLKKVYTEINKKFDKELAKDNLTDEERAIIEEYMDYQTSLIDIINHQNGIPEFDKDAYRSSKKEAIAEIVKKAKEEHFNNINDIAKELGLMSFEEWDKLPFINKLSRRARNNYILHRFIEIMNDENSREEQYGRSNFDDIVNGDTGANDVINKLYNIFDATTSPYNPVDQLNNMEDAMDGAKLKGLSVFWDNFVSRNNKIRAMLDESASVPVIITVGEKVADESEIIHNEEEITKSYEEDVEDFNNETIYNEKEKIIIEYNGYWTRDNVEKDTKNLYIFTDNTDRDSGIELIDSNSNYAKKYGVDKHYPKTTQAVIRGLNNAMPISTQRWYNKEKKGVNGNWKDTDFDDFKKVIDEEIDAIKQEWNSGKYKKLIIGKKDGFFNTKISNITKERVPKIYEYLELKLNELYDYVNTNNSNIKEHTIFTNSGKKKLKLTARKVGHSKNNRNIVGKLVTTYSSQTTAHHLDAVKMGSVPNVNQFTFGVYKLLSALGIDYETNIAFIRQPIITSLVTNNKLRDSIYFKDDFPVHYKTLVELAKKHIVLENEYPTTDELFDSIREQTNIDALVSKYLNMPLDNLNNNVYKTIKFPLDKELLFNRIKTFKEGIENEETFVFDLLILQTFKNIDNTASFIQNVLIRSTNIDKDGAKPSIYENKKEIEFINKHEDNTTLNKNGVPFLKLIYSVDEDGNINVDKSEYKPLAEIYKHVLVPSTVVNTQIITTENEDFDAARISIEKRLGRRLNKEEYFEYKKYMIMHLFNYCKQLLSPILLNNKGQIQIISSTTSENENKLKLANKFWEQERTRIFGYGVIDDGYFEIENINNPTEKEINKFIKLTPAQKVLFIQKTFADNPGIFGNLKITNINNTDVKYRGISRQYIAYDDYVDNVEELLFEFANSFFNHNKLIKLAAIDLIKYAFVAEGFTFKPGNVSKIVSNNTLYSNIENGGTGLVETTDDHIHILLDEIETNDEFFDNFIRSHSYLIPINRLADLPKTKYKNESVLFSENTRTDSSVVITNKSNLYKKLDLANKNNKFIRIDFPNPNGRHLVLYKVHLNSNGTAILIPYNLLDRYETFDYSYNQNYNIFNSKDYFKQVLASFYNNVSFTFKVEPVKSKFKLSYPIVNDVAFLEKIRNDSNLKLSGAVEKIVKDFIKFNSNTKNAGMTYYEVNQSPELSMIVPTEVHIPQTIINQNGEKINILIKRHENTESTRKKYLKIITTKGEYVDKSNSSLINVVNTLLNTGVDPRFVKFYEIKLDDTRHADTELLNEEEIENLIDTNIAHNSPTTNLAVNIIDEINHIKIKYATPISKRFIEEMNNRYINVGNMQSINDNEENIFKAAARYYETAANIILNKIENYSIGLETYQIDDKKLYEALSQHDEYFSDIATLILDGITFGNRISEIFKLDLTVEDEETARYIKRIINAINSVKQNDKIKKGLELLINEYMKKYSTNPEIFDDIIKLREAFGDIDVIDSLFANPADLQNNETQVFIKKVRTILDKAQMFEVEENVKEFKDAIATIEDMDGESDINKIIDMDNFRIRQDYNEQYLEDRQKIFDEYNEARSSRYVDFNHFKNYVNVALKKDKFIFNHQHQYLPDEYYKRNIQLREKVIAIAGDVYYKYLELTNLIYHNPDKELSNIEKEKYTRQLLDLRSEVTDTGIVKDEDLIYKIRALNEYIENKQKLEEEYFVKQAYEGFAENYKRYDKFIKDYDKNHITETLEEKLQNEDYNEAYYWIKNNGKLRYGEEARNKLKAAFKVLLDRNNAISSKRMNGFRNLGAVDENGVVNAMIFNDKQLTLLKEEEQSDLSKMYEDGLGETILIKFTPKNLPLVDRKKLKDGEFKKEPEKMLIIQQINEILAKCIDLNTNELEISLLFNDKVVSNEERNKLIKLYTELKKYRKEKFNNFAYTYETNYEAYCKALLYYNTVLKNSMQGQQFIEIFVDTDVSGNPIPNEDIFGYKKVNDGFIDKEKTNAIEFLNKNVTFVTTKYYDIAKNKAVSEGQEAFEKWFDQNHIYNPYTHRYQPLKVWTTMSEIPGSELAESIEYTPSFENMERYAKQINKNYTEFSVNYRKGDAKYDTNIKLNAKEEELRNTLSRFINKHSHTYKAKRFFAQGYLPRERATEINWNYVGKQFAGLLGISASSGRDSDSFYTSTEYSNDHEAEMNNVGLLQAKGTKEFKHIPVRKANQTLEDYEKEVAKVREENRQIARDNANIDKALVNRDWKGVMERFIHNATIYNSRRQAAPYLYLLLEDLKANRAYLTKGLWNQRVITNKHGQPIETDMNNTHEIVHNYARRILYNQFHETGSKRKIANVLQNMSSAKFMMLNLYGGVSNIAIGATNIAMEHFANEYFNVKDLASAQSQYLANIFDYIANMYNNESYSLTGALIKRFNVVKLDDFVEFGDNESIDSKIRRVRSWMYGFQSMGEHLMQNTVLLAMLKSNKLYIDNGKLVIGDFNNYTKMLERAAMIETLKDNPELSNAYEQFIKNKKYDIKGKFDIINGRKDLNREFLRGIRSFNEDTFKELVDKYVSIKNKLSEKYESKFKSYDSIESLFVLENGVATFDKEKLTEYIKNYKITKEDIKNLMAEFKGKVVEVNHKIHGVYDKLHAAQVEKKWYGSMLMQFRKHLYTGAFKRFRRRGYYSEFRGTKERGIYQTLIDFLGTEFEDFSKRKKNIVEKDNANEVLAAMQVIFESVYNTFLHYNTNKKLVSNWEAANMRRILGDLGGMLTPMLITTALYALWDDDEIKDDRFKSSLLYLADRMYSDASMYTPYGVATEWKNIYRSPAASANGPSDLLKATQVLTQALFDPNYEPNYKNGMYRGINKLEVLLRRNTPIVRSIDRIILITKNNKYYKVGESQIGINIAKTFGETLND